MLSDFKPLLMMLLFWFDACFLPALLLCVFFDWRALIIPLVPGIALAILEGRRREKAQLFKWKYRAPGPEAVDDYIKMIKKRE